MNATFAAIMLGPYCPLDAPYSPNQNCNPPSRRNGSASQNSTFMLVENSILAGNRLSWHERLLKRSGPDLIYCRARGCRSVQCVCLLRGRGAACSGFVYERTYALSPLLPKTVRLTSLRCTYARLLTRKLYTLTTRDSRSNGSRRDKRFEARLACVFE
jgi:hypothetical protein